MVLWGFKDNAEWPRIIIHFYEAALEVFVKTAS